MSSDEEFSLVPENDEEPTMRAVQMEIEKYKVIHERIMNDQRDLSKARDEQLLLIKAYNKRSVQLRKMLQEEEQDQVKAEEDKKVRLVAVREEERKLKEQLVSMRAQLLHLDKQTTILRRQAKVSSALPERKVVFLGAVSQEGDSSRFHLKSRIVYPMEGGTALITFEEEEVAQNILRLKQHDIMLGECCLTLEASPVNFLMPSRVEVMSQVCPKRVLVSDVPKEVEEARLLDRLEIHFSKRRNQGGEVDRAEMLPGSGDAVLTFVEDAVAKGLTDRQYHEVDMGEGKRHRVKLTPYVSGEISHLQTRGSLCTRTVLLTGIPAIMDPDDLQDQLQIHFQKSSNGGGEVEAVVYNPLRRRTLAVFEDDPPAETD